EVAARRIAWGKWLNAGQTCVAPDYVLVSDARRDELVDAIAEAFEKFGDGDIAQSADFGRIVSQRHFDRLVSLLDGHELAYSGESDPETVTSPPQSLWTRPPTRL
ncbi:MAG: aldehyde dehydrogenase family protein, partial [Acidobacteria bacterium]|nr:aldehyde dehydrogenase family protein [Acidobacteriota bacterium]